MLYKGAVARREWPLSILNLFLDVVPQRLQNRNRQHLKHSGCTMHQFVRRYRLPHVVQLKQIVRLGFQFFLELVMSAQRRPRGLVPVSQSGEGTDGSPSAIEARRVSAACSQSSLMAGSVSPR